MNDLITRARKEWCEAAAVNVGSYTEPLLYSRNPWPCPPEVVAALLDALTWAKTEDCAPYANRVCDCCTALGKIEDAITRALEEKP
jgi:hypothetical protein